MHANMGRYSHTCQRDSATASTWLPLTTGLAALRLFDLLYEVLTTGLECSHLRDFCVYMTKFVFSILFSLLSHLRRRGLGPPQRPNRDGIGNTTTQDSKTKGLSRIGHTFGAGGLPLHGYVPNKVYWVLTLSFF